MTSSLHPHAACEFRRKLGWSLCLALVLVAVLGLRGMAQTPAGDQHQPSTGGHEAQAPPAEHATAGEHEGEEHGGLSGLLWPTVNFLILVGVLNYYLRTPISQYLGSRSTQIRQDLVEAADLNRTAAAQLADVERKMQALPAELDALKKRGVEEIVAEEERIASAAAADRARLLTQTRREIDVRLQAAQRELSDHAANLALELATKRLAAEMTPADHARLVDRYTSQVKER